jgi:tetratricopeptide (TPR) repeat protein
LWERGEIAPESVRSEAAFFYGFLAQPKRAIGVMDEREYFLGEFALIAGTQCRSLSRREEARLWLDRADASFRLTVRIQADLSRVAYQRLALRLEERACEEVLELAAPLGESFRQLGMLEDALKVRFLEGLAKQELGDNEGALSVFQSACDEAEALGSQRLLGFALSNAYMLQAELGQLKDAFESSHRALSIFRELDNRVGLAKLQWHTGGLFRTQGRAADAIQAFRDALDSFRALNMRGEVAALHLVVADVLLDQGAEAQAEWEIRAALPIIDEEKMVPEGMAAYALLRESVRRRKIDRNALRDVHGYFQQ